MSGCCVGPRIILQQGGDPVAPVHGFEVLQTSPIDLRPPPSGTWVDVPLEVQLPEAGTYQLDANIRSAISGTAPVNVFITGRLLDVTTGTVVPDSEAHLGQVNHFPAGSGSSGLNEQRPILLEYTVTGPAVIRVQARRTDAIGTPTTAGIWSDANGKTSLRFWRVA